MGKLMVNLIAGCILFSGVANATDNAMDMNYDKVYSTCSEKADSADGAYEEVFTSCMKAKGFSEHEDGSSPYSSSIGTGPEAEPEVLLPAEKKSL